MYPPNVERGDWLQTKGQHSKVALKFYDAPPMAGKEVHWRECPNFYIGPVHDVAVHGHFLTARVPHPDQPATDWCTATFGLANHTEMAIGDLLTSVR